MPYCYDCGAATVEQDGVPCCSEHGPRWKLVKNSPAANVVVVRPGDGAVLVGRRALEPYLGCWEVPGGFVNLGEHPADAARRELQEELGIDVTLTGWLGTYVFETPVGEWIQAATYVGTGDGPLVVDPHELLGAGWFAPDQLPDQLVASHRRRLDDWAAGRAVPLPASRR